MELLLNLEGNAGEICCAAFSPDFSLIAAGCDDGQIYRSSFQ
jgi:hypothetical protein